MIPPGSDKTPLRVIERYLAGELSIDDAAKELLAGPGGSMTMDHLDPARWPQIEELMNHALLRASIEASESRDSST